MPFGFVRYNVTQPFIHWLELMAGLIPCNVTYLLDSYHSMSIACLNAECLVIIACLNRENSMIIACLNREYSIIIARFNWEYFMPITFLNREY